MDSTPLRVAARCLIFDADGRVLMMHRRHEGTEYIVAIGGGVEPGESLAAAAHRECREEAGANVHVGSVVHLISDGGATPSLQYVFAARLVAGDEEHRTGPEYQRSDRGTYEPIWLERGDDRLRLVQPESLRELIATKYDHLRAQADIVEEEDLA